MRTLIVAEAGVNHNGDLETAKTLVAAAAKAGADVVKFQTFRADKLATANAAKADYQKKLTDEHESQREMISRLELSLAEFKELKAECIRHGIEFLSTAFDEESLQEILDLGVSLIKVPSGEITNIPYLRRVGLAGRPILLSTGMANMGEIEQAIDVLERSGVKRDQLTVLHCTTEYPAPYSEINLKAMQSLATAFNVRVGYSDHTLGTEVPIAAVALGAIVIEKHITLDSNLPGPDHRASLKPCEFESMVKCIRNIECALGDGVKRPTSSELGNRAAARKSIVASRAIARGESFSEENIAVKRPGTGISAARWDEVIGVLAKRDFITDEQIDL